MLRYSVSIRYDANDSIFVANVPELSGCMAHGETYEAALREIKTAMELWLEDAAANNEHVPKPLLHVS